MTSQVTNTAINEAASLSNTAKALLVSLNSGTASVTSIAASQVSLAEKAVAQAVLGATATRAGINNSETDLNFKQIALAIANV